MNRAGQYVPATPVEGSVVVNIADMMQRWTADRLVSTVCSTCHATKPLILPSINVLRNITSYYVIVMIYDY